ncbi:MAG: HEAT repeat domain-containing protein [Candidatus Aminicenantes bacterium]|nr:HEAT repeat domain-containing protein [Candidatus Aminicenantes bacterium]
MSIKNEESSSKMLEEYAADIVKIKKAREIVQLLAKTATQMKIFASDHQNINKFAADLYDKTASFLKEYGKFELGIQEFSFTYEGKVIHTDTQIKKSLPFLFYKDGIQEISFYKDLNEGEFLDFLEIIKREGLRPAEESDVVISLWEKDFANIRYSDSPEYLESRIGIGMEIPEYRYDHNALVTGKLELDDEDKLALGEATLALELASTKSDTLEKNDVEITEEGMVPLSYALDNEEMKKLEAMIQRNRQITAEEELLALILELLYLEERPEHFNDTVDALSRYHDDLLEKENFSVAVQLLNSVHEIKENLGLAQSAKKSVLDTFLNNVVSNDALAGLQNRLEAKLPSDIDSLSDYMQILGPRSIRILGKLLDRKDLAQSRKKLLKSFKALGASDIQSMMTAARDDKPDITKAVISVLGETGDSRVIQHLAVFVGYKNKAIKSEAIQALGRFDDATANKILLAFLKDEDEKIRIEAAGSFQYVADASVMDYALKEVGSKDFKNKNDEEIRAFLELIGKRPSPEGYRTLRSFLRKPGLFAAAKTTGIGLLAVDVLKSMSTAEAKKILEEGTRLNNKKIKQACKKALRNLSVSTETRNTKEGEQ